MNTDMKKKGTEGTKFSGGLGYVMAVAGSAVGLGNIWRFPYLAAKYGGGMFLLVYLVLMFTFGYTLIISETALGRMTGKSPVGAFGYFGSGLPFKFGGWINALIPMLIVPYYCVIGGWVSKYFFEYAMGKSALLADGSYFSDFISSAVSVEFWFVVFAAAVFFVIFAGVKHGVERLSKIMMPVLILLAVVMSVYSITRPGAFEGVKYFLIPDFKNFSWMTVVAAMGQMFFSLSIAMGVLYTYGSYIKKDVDIEKSTKQVEIFDTLIAVLAGLMIIPAVFAFSGGDPQALEAGPSLMFVTMPKVFDSMGFGGFAGGIFFLLVFLAALTSAVSLAETSVSTFSERFGWGRGKSAALAGIIVFVLGSASALDSSLLSSLKIFGMSVLDFFDFLTNSVMMPAAAFATCILILRAAGLGAIAKEIELSSRFGRKKLYNFLMKYLVPAFLIIIFLSSLANVFGLIAL